MYLQHTQICLNVLRNIFTHIFHGIVPADKANLAQCIEGAHSLQFNQLHLHNSSKGNWLAQMWQDLMQMKQNIKSTGSIVCTAEAHSEEGNSLNVQCIDMLKLNHLNLHYHEMCGPVLSITNDFSFPLISFLLTCTQKPVWVICACEASDNSNWRTPQVKYYPWQLLDLAHFCHMDALPGTKRERGGGQKGS